MGTPRAEMVLPVNGLTPYLRLRISTYAGAILVQDRRTLLGLIPLWRRRVEVPSVDLTDGRVHTVVRPTCLLAASALLAAIFVTDLPVLASAALGLAAAPMAFLAFVKALRIERASGEHWTFPMCRYYAFDAELALLDAVEAGRAFHGATPVAA